MEWEVFEILEEKIDLVMDKIQTLSRENTKLKQKVQEQEGLVHAAREQLDNLEEEKEIIKGKVGSILDKINQVLV
jgi:FtsZ-binding cell division protein ZapB